MPSATLSASIIIPNYNGRQLLEKHLPAVIAAAPGSQIIVVDDASTDESVAFLKQTYPEIEVITHDHNQRFAAACNSGVSAAVGDVIILLNSDVAPAPDFLTPLLKQFETETVFAVGCKEIDPQTGQESGRACGGFARGLLVHWRCEDQSKNTTLWASGGSGAFRRSMWHELGGMDTLFAPAYEEDRDLSYRALKRGWWVLFEPNSLVYHHHETTNKKFLGSFRMSTASYKNHLLLVWKNISDRKLIAEHLKWLPYHLTVTTFKTKGLFLMGFLWALTQLPAVFAYRYEQSGKEVVTDQEVLANFS